MQMKSEIAGEAEKERHTQRGIDAIKITGAGLHTPLDDTLRLSRTLLR